ncbi:MAG: DEAD/DEAH box helicase, partial [Bacteroidaceae bacterium]|nr:DEAD/DEAH box helicase [Bacteroidaceae bacterium]
MKLGIQDLNVMQQDMMQAFRKHDNLVLLSPTGSGKTLAYLLPLFEMLRADDSGLQAMVIVPSRELALQTLKVVKDSGTPLRASAVYGGHPAMEESRSMRGIRPQLVVGTPGRLLDHLQKGNIDAGGIRTIILDEFDKCLEMGFREEMAHVFSYLRGVSKRVLLSATDDSEITGFLPSAVRLDYLDESSRTENVEPFVVKSPEKDKLETFRALLLARGQESSLVFVGYRESVERIAKYLRSEGFIISAMHGAMEQKNRERELYRFLEGSTNVFVCTDLASRGLDIPALDNV